MSSQRCSPLCTFAGARATVHKLARITPDTTAGKHDEAENDEDELHVPTLIDPDSFRLHEKNEECTPALFDAGGSDSLRLHADQVCTLSTG
jgi:hypothetical protein